MNREQAIAIMEQAVQLAVRGCAKIDDMKAILIAWDKIKPLIKTEDENHEV